MKKACIIGCGRTARALTAYLMSKDDSLEISLWCRDTEKANLVNEHGISVAGCIDGEFHPKAFSDIDRAVKSAEYIFVMTTSNGHKPVAEQLAGHLEKGQTIIIFNGNWGACEFYGIIGEEAIAKEVLICETGAMMFLADYEGDSVNIKKIKNNISLSSIPSAEVDKVIEKLSDFFPQFVPVKNVLTTSFNNSNPVIHGPVTLFNITRIANGEDFLFYDAGTTEAVVRYIELIDAERCAVASKMGATPETCLQIVNSFWPDKYDSLYAAIKNNKAYMTGKGPKTTNYRYLTEDVPYGLAAVAMFGKKFSVETPYTDAMLMCYYGLFPELLTQQVDLSNIDVLELL